MARSALAWSSCAWNWSFSIVNSGWPASTSWPSVNECCSRKPSSLRQEVDLVDGNDPTVGMDTVMAMRIDLPGELPEPMDPMAMDEFLNKKEGYEITEADQQMMAFGKELLVGQFLIDRGGIVRWSSTEVSGG